MQGDETAAQITVRVLSDSSLVPDIADSNQTTVPSDLSNLYAQFYAQSTYLPQSTGIPYSVSLITGGSLPYDGQGAS
jgi:hypothetical protein